MLYTQIGGRSPLFTSSDYQSSSNPDVGGGGTGGCRLPRVGLPDRFGSFLGILVSAEFAVESSAVADSCKWLSVSWTGGGRFGLGLLSDLLVRLDDFNEL